ncbi:cytochrome P450 [Cadophora sp. MPI-SDFR-AT-0126]|nr:cytochrome P450 [Leotiomycetes sp. MPI-SDFR-AT-0126]
MAILQSDSKLLALASSYQAFGWAFVSICVLKYISDSRKTNHTIPGVGFDSFPLLKQWRAAYRLMSSPKMLMLEGYDKYKDGYFRISTPQYEYVIVSDHDKINEFLGAPEDTLSFIDSSNEAFQIPWTMGKGVAFNHYHTVIVRTKLTQKIQNLVPILIPEIEERFNTLVGDPSDWKELCIYDVIVEAVARVSNKAFVGSPLCHNQEYLQNAMSYAQDVVLSAELIRIFPNWIKSTLVRLTPIHRRRRVAMKFLGPLIRERLAIADERSNEQPRPDDMLQWLCEAAPPSERTVDRLLELLMGLNVASIHTTTMTTANAAYALAEEPEKYLDELRQEISENCNPDGTFNKANMSKLKKMDSFLREVGRVKNPGLVNLARNVKKDFQFKDGTVVKAGTVIAVPSHSLQRDPAFFSSPEDFDGFRFSRQQEEGAGTGKVTKHQMVSTDLNHLAFGHGKHACPGRFFAVNEMKMILAHIIARYDFKLVPGNLPNVFYVGTMGIADTKLKILVRARQ